MASTYTPLGVELMATGENAGTWGTKTNANLNLVEGITGGYVVATLNAAGAGANTTDLTVSDGGLTGQCYNGIQASNPYVSPDAFVVQPGDNGVFKGTIKPKDPDYGCGDYRYYFIQDGTTILDSIDVTVCKTASIEEVTPALSISVAPNPASSYFKVKTNDVVGATVQVVDVLGNVVLKETVMGSSKTINTENFRNGVYFVRVSANNQRPINRKVIVRH